MPLSLLWGCLCAQMWLLIYPCTCAHVWNKLHPNLLQLDLCSSGSSAADVKREGSTGETAAQNRASSLGERRVQRARLAPTGPANTAHLPLQFYFHIISISKSCLAALAFGSDKRRVSEGVEGWKKKGKGGRKRTAMNMHFMCWYCNELSDAYTHAGGTHPVLYALVLVFQFSQSVNQSVSFNSVTSKWHVYANSVYKVMLWMNRYHLMSPMGELG